MARERNRSLELKKYIESLGIDVNIGQTKARGNRGVFIHGKNRYRIDVAKNLSEEEILSVLVHEFAHYVHYKNDKSLKSIDFAFGQVDDEILDELISVTVQNVPKEFAASLFEAKKSASDEIQTLKKEIKTAYPDFKLSEKHRAIERGMSLAVKYLLKYDNVKIFNKIMPKLIFDDIVFPKQPVVISQNNDSMPTKTNKSDYTIIDIFKLIKRNQMHLNLDTDIRVSGSFKSPVQKGYFNLSKIFLLK